MSKDAKDPTNGAEDTLEHKAAEPSRWERYKPKSGGALIPGLIGAMIALAGIGVGMAIEHDDGDETQVSNVSAAADRGDGDERFDHRRYGPEDRGDDPGLAPDEKPYRNGPGGPDMPPGALPQIPGIPDEMRQEFHRGLRRALPGAMGTLRELRQALRDGKITDAERKAIEERVQKLLELRKEFREQAR